MFRRPLALSAAALIAAAVVAVPLAAGRTHAGPRTLTLGFAKPAKTYIDDVAPKTAGKGRLSLGDRMVGVQGITRDGKVVGTGHSVATITNRTPSPYSHFNANIDVVAHLNDGDLYAVGFVDSATTGDHYAIVGGTGAYEGARGSAQGSEDGMVVTLDQ